MTKHCLLKHYANIHVYYFQTRFIIPLRNTGRSWDTYLSSVSFLSIRIQNNKMKNIYMLVSSDSPSICGYLSILVLESFVTANTNGMLYIRYTPNTVHKELPSVSRLKHNSIQYPCVPRFPIKVCVHTATRLEGEHTLYVRQCTTLLLPEHQQSTGTTTPCHQIWQQ